MGVIKQFNYVQGANQLYVEDFANISNSANNALAGLPWTTPLSICNASFSGSGSSKVLNITPDTLVVVNGIVFGSDITVQMTSSQYLYAVCEYDTSQPRQDGEGDQYYQAVVRKIQVLDSPLADTDLSNASIFPGIGNYLILTTGFRDTKNCIQINSDGSISPFKSVIPDGGVTPIKNSLNPFLNPSMSRVVISGKPSAIQINPGDSIYVDTTDIAAVYTMIRVMFNVSAGIPASAILTYNNRKPTGNPLGVLYSDSLGHGPIAVSNLLSGEICSIFLSKDSNDNLFIFPYLLDGPGLVIFND